MERIFLKLIVPPTGICARRPLKNFFEYTVQQQFPVAATRAFLIEVIDRLEDTDQSAIIVKALGSCFVTPVSKGLPNLVVAKFILGAKFDLFKLGVTAHQTAKQRMQKFMQLTHIFWQL